VGLGGVVDAGGVLVGRCWVLQQWRVSNTASRRGGGLLPSAKPVVATERLCRRRRELWSEDRRL